MRSIALITLAVVMLLIAWHRHRDSAVTAPGYKLLGRCLGWMGAATLLNVPELSRAIDSLVHYPNAAVFVSQLFVVLSGRAANDVATAGGGHKSLHDRVYVCVGLVLFATFVYADAATVEHPELFEATASVGRWAPYWLVFCTWAGGIAYLLAWHISHDSRELTADARTSSRIIAVGLTLEGTFAVLKTLMILRVNGLNTVSIVVLVTGSALVALGVLWASFAPRVRRLRRRGRVLRLWEDVTALAPDVRGPERPKTEHRALIEIQDALVQAASRGVPISPSTAAMNTVTNRPLNELDQTMLDLIRLHEGQHRP